jgi:hypothetical protein
LYDDPGADYFERRHDPSVEAKRLGQRIEALGFDVTITKSAATLAVQLLRSFMPDPGLVSRAQAHRGGKAFHPRELVDFPESVVYFYFFVANG